MKRKLLSLGLTTLLEYFYEKLFNGDNFGESTLDELDLKIKKYTFSKYEEFLKGDQSMPLEWTLELDNNPSE